MPVCAGALSAIATPTLDYAWASAAQTDCNDSSGGVFLGLGGLILNVDDGAAGTYVIDFDPDANNSFMTSGAGTPIPGVVFTPACITIITGSCCFNLGPNVDCEDGVTEGACDAGHIGATIFRGDVTCAEEACPSCLTDSDCNDGDACTDDSCNTATFLCSNTLNFDPGVDC